MADERFRIIEGGYPAKPKPSRKDASKTHWECRICAPSDNVRFRGLVKVRWGAMEDGQLRLSGGRDVWVCAMCLAQGRYTPQTS